MMHIKCRRAQKPRDANDRKRSVASIALFLVDPAGITALYRRPGIAFEDNHRGNGLIHPACDLGSAHFAIIRALRRQLLTGFYVSSLEGTLAAEWRRKHKRAGPPCRILRMPQGAADGPAGCAAAFAG
jgi:hypothetical protein